MIGTIVAAVLAILVIVLLIKGFKIIPQSETMVIERLGRYNRTLQGGINFICPLIEKPRSILWRTSRKVAGDKLSPTIETKHIDLREQVYDYPSQSVITKDNVNIEIDALLYFQITDAKKAVYEIADLPNAIEKLTQTTLRNVVGGMELDETLTSRDIINEKLRTILDDATDKWGVKVNRVELKDITPPAGIREQMEKQMRAEREKRSAILIAEGEKQTKILEAEGFQTSEINKAEGERQSSILRAEGESEARLKKAEAEARAIELVKSAFTDESKAAEYLVAVRYLEALQTMTEGKDNKVIYMPYEATGVLSSLGGIKELLGNKS